MILPVAASSAYRTPSLDPMKTFCSFTSGEDSIGPPVLNAQTRLPSATFSAYTFSSVEPTKTRFCVMAAEDLTAPPVLKVQTEANFGGKLPSATPIRAGPPRNIGQSAASATLPARQSSPPPQRTKRADFLKASKKVTAVNSKEVSARKMGGANEKYSHVSFFVCVGGAQSSSSARN